MPNGIDSDFNKLKQIVDDFCAARGYGLSADAEAIMRDMIRMKQLTGDFYCPCQAQRTAETICICQAARNGLVDLMGACFCNLIVSEKEDKE